MNARSQIASFRDLQTWLELDLQAHNLESWNFAKRYRYPVVHYQRLLRIVEYLQGQNGPLFRTGRFYFRFRLHRVSVQTGITIPPQTFGPGLSIAHYGSIVVNSRARVGALCRIHSATNIGVANDGVPTIGNRVYIGPGAVIYGAINIGNNVTIGANAVVNSDVPSDVTIAGAPARVISKAGSSAIMPSWFPATEDLGVGKK